MLGFIAFMIVLAYTGSSGLGLWLSRQASAAARAGAALSGPLAQAPPHHRTLLADYADGWRGRAWQASFALLCLTLFAMLGGGRWAAASFGAALAIDSLLFLSYPGRHSFVGAMDAKERTIDVAQCVALLLALTILTFAG